MLEPGPHTPRLNGREVILPGTTEATSAFRTMRAFVCPRFLDGGLLATVMRASEGSAFVSNDIQALGHREIESPPRLGTAIQISLRAPALHRWLEEVTGQGPITRVDGRVAQTRVRDGDELGWHDDMNGEDRRLGITINLGTRDYKGGLFEMRDRLSQSPLLQFRHDEPGTALIFEVSHRCEHRVHPLISGGPRRVFAGWFLA
jgi:hypothetical protein